MDIQEFYKNTARGSDKVYRKLSKERLEYEFYVFGTAIVCALAYFWNLPRMIFWLAWKSLPFRVSTQDLRSYERNSDRYTFDKRCWVYLQGEQIFKAQLTFPGYHYMLGVSLGGEDQSIGFTIAPFGLFYLSFDFCNVFSRSTLEKISTFLNYSELYDDEIQTEIYWFENIIWIKLLTRSFSDKYGFSWNLNIFEFLLGKTVYSSEELQSELVDIEIPGDDDIYPVQITLSRDTWRYSRLWFPSQIVNRLHADCERGIPHYSKRGEDASFGWTAPCKPELGAAIAYIQKSVTDDRTRSGGRFKPLEPTNLELAA